MQQFMTLLVAFMVGFIMYLFSYYLICQIHATPISKVSSEKNQVLKDIFVVISGVFILGLLIAIITYSLHYAALITTGFLFFLSIFIISDIKHQNKRRVSISKELPVLLDYLVLQVNSGHSIQQALRSASGLFLNNSHLYQALKEMDDSMRLGSTINEGLVNLRKRLDTNSAEVPIEAINKAIENGTPLGRILSAQSNRMREDLILDGENFANTASIKILIPLLFFIFPASFLVIFSPVLVSLSGRLP